MLRVLSRWCAFGGTLFGLGLATAPAQGEVLFRGDFETGDLEQWSNLLKEEGLSVVDDPVAEGKHAGKVSITKNELWPNGLNRVEVQHTPDEQYTAEGAEIYYGYSFYLPEELTEDDHQIFYWETNAKNTGNYQQMMQVGVTGQHMRFATQKPQYKIHWQADNLVTAKVWHRLAIHIKFANNAQVGSVDLWFDGQQVVTGAKAQTYIGDPAFVQHGILRDTIDKVEVLYMDDARSGTTLEDVLMPTNAGGGGAGGAAGAGGNGGASGAMSGGSATGGMPGSSGSASGGSGATLAGTSTGGSGGAATSGGMGLGATPTSDDSSCGCRVGTARDSGGWLAAAVAAFGLALARRRRRR